MLHVEKTKWLLLLTLGILVIGVTFVYSASGPYAARQEIRAFAQALSSPSAPDIVPSAHAMGYFWRQFMWASLSIILMVLVARVDWQVHEKYSIVYMIISLILLILVLIPPIGVRVNGAMRWIRLGPIQIQASEFAKIALILHFARLLTLLEHDSGRSAFTKGLLPMLMWLALFCGLIIIEPDLGTCVILGAIALAMWMVGGIAINYIASMIVGGVVAVAFAIYAEPYRLRRLFAFLDPEKDPLGAGYHLFNSLIAIGTGGLTGRGSGVGDGMAKYLFLNECHTDFIFSVICEETGFIGATIVILSFLVFSLLGYSVAKHCYDSLYARLVAVGITTMIATQAFGNMMVAVGLAPTKGLALPLVSYGGSSLLANMVAIGILLRIAMHVDEEDARRREILQASSNRNGARGTI